MCELLGFAHVSTRYRTCWDRILKEKIVKLNSLVAPSHIPKQQQQVLPFNMVLSLYEYEKRNTYILFL